MRALPLGVVGYHAQSTDGDPLGVVDAVGARGLHLGAMPGHPGERGYVPAEAVVAIDARTDTVTLDGITPAWAALTPVPDDDDAHRTDDPWADRVGDLGLWNPRGRANGPFLHPGAR